MPGTFFTEIVERPLERIAPRAVIIAGLNDLLDWPGISHLRETLVRSVGQGAVGTRFSDKVPVNQFLPRLREIQRGRWNEPCDDLACVLGVSSFEGLRLLDVVDAARDSALQLAGNQLIVEPSGSGDYAGSTANDDLVLGLEAAASLFKAAGRMFVPLVRRDALPFNAQKPDLEAHAERDPFTQLGNGKLVVEQASFLVRNHRAPSEYDENEWQSAGTHLKKISRKLELVLPHDLIAANDGRFQLLPSLSRPVRCLTQKPDCP